VQQSMATAAPSAWERKRESYGRWGEKEENGDAPAGLKKIRTG
jgi:hypothetical protein